MGFSFSGSLGSRGLTTNSVICFYLLGKTNIKSKKVDPAIMFQPAVGISDEDSHADLLRAAAECFMERGYVETSVDDVARRIGATKGRIYHHFRSKAELFTGVFRAGMEMNQAAIAPHRDASGPALARLRRMAAAHCRQAIMSKPHQWVVWQGLQMVLRGATTPELKAELVGLKDDRDAYERIFAEELKRSRDEGAVCFDNLGLAATLMLASLNSPIFWYAPRAGETQTDIDELVSQVVAYAMRGFGSKED
jgi:AcrR family transcriptional regulator